MGKRRREDSDKRVEHSSIPAENPTTNEKKRKFEHDSRNSSTTIQIIIGTYEKVLHGLTATVKPPPTTSPSDPRKVNFADTFLLSAHTSSIRSLALSPPSTSQKRTLATGSSDQIINLYHISTTPPPQSIKNPTLAGTHDIAQNTRNRELGSLQHHGGAVNVLCFPTRSKLLSGAEDNTIAVTRTRDYTVLSTIKAPLPKAHGRPSGDTAPLGTSPAGINDFAVHPSMKLMISVGKGERCMRLWNLVTGKKAAVLEFDRNMLQGVGEGRWGSGEGRRVVWDGEGEEFVVGFERGALVFGLDSKPKSRVLPEPRTKIHQIHYLPAPSHNDAKENILALSTEDGRIIFHSTISTTPAGPTSDAVKLKIPTCNAIAQLGGPSESVTNRIKDFEILDLPESTTSFIVTGSSDGAIRLWLLDRTELTPRPQQSGRDAKDAVNGDATGVNAMAGKAATVKQVGKLLGTYEAGNRITCLKAFIMSEPAKSEGDGIEDGVACLENAIAHEESEGDSS